MELVEDTKIDGEFKGWDGNRIFELANGHWWQQVRYRYQYHYAYRPEARVYSDGNAYYLEVDGMDDKIEVRQVR